MNVLIEMSCNFGAKNELLLRHMYTIHFLFWTNRASLGFISPVSVTRALYHVEERSSPEKRKGRKYFSALCQSQTPDVTLSALVLALAFFSA